MSDIMLHGVLNMPLPDDPAELSLIEWHQFRQRARQASARIEALEAALLAADELARVCEAMADACNSGIADDALAAYRNRRATGGGE